MTRRIVLLLVAVLGIALIITSSRRQPAASAQQPAPSGRLVLHEWGTFTGLAASDGTHLPFHVNIGYDLPAFVKNRERFATDRDMSLKNHLLFIKANGIAALQRMETPIVYFYADRPMDLNFRVSFPQGSLSEFYPPVQAMGPEFGLGLGEPRVARMPTTAPAGDLAAAAPPPSFLDWGRLQIVPRPTGSEGSLIPPVDGKERYGFARATDSALVRLTDHDGKLHEEKFLFYRGLGNFTLPVTLAALGNDRYEIRNSGTEPLTAALLLRTEPNAAGPSRFVLVTDITSTKQVDLPAAQSATGDVQEQIVQTLIAQGLYEKEARAMLATWKSTWLGEPGARLLYIVPRATTDRLLPLQVTPTPTETVRVLVGRIDSISPEFEDRLQSMITRSVLLGEFGISEAEAKELKSLDRFLSPALDRAAAVRGTPDAQRDANKLWSAVHAKLAPSKQ